MFRTACHLPLSLAISIQSTSPKPIYFRTILVLSSLLWLVLQVVTFPQFPTPNTNTHIFSRTYVQRKCHTIPVLQALCVIEVCPWLERFLRCSVTQHHLVGRRPEIKIFASDSSIITLFSEVCVTKTYWSLKRYRWQWLTAQADARKETL